ncbi:hypothetical protein AMIS_2300 [Actinoplanes missouriensis 431]|uniref:Uncharacterized protein n=1 Tax=Actinoplanes missouriensis (strain ATCC 14538 / DSM 43046 / CBS 188.64 / JCM 3121 / NBRC 102363 / NCIMB 12654 / NRRL B-3342 / UNCC 431) TaxID=512565 RepID=I0GXG3_ACTM4|nr:hypothetical protein AMIS_2300 [Actinoplanes missouriensis 431]
MAGRRRLDIFSGPPPRTAAAGAPWLAPGRLAAAQNPGSARRAEARNVTRRQQYPIEHGRRRLWRRGRPWKVGCRCGVDAYPCPAERQRVRCARPSEPIRSFGRRPVNAGRWR